MRNWISIFVASIVLAVIANNASAQQCRMVNGRMICSAPLVAKKVALPVARTAGLVVRTPRRVLRRAGCASCR